MPGENVTQQQLRSRSWWSGPEIYLVVDDYDLVASATGNPLTPLVDYLPHAKDLGLHVIVARRSGGAARAMFDPVLARLRDLGCMGLMMSASPDEGILLGAVRPSRTTAGARNTHYARTPRSADPGGLDRSAMTGIVVEVGPATVRGPNHADAEWISAGIDGIDDELTLIDECPVTVADVWRTVMHDVVGGSADTIALVCPTWWASSRVDRVRDAASTVAHDVVVLRRAQALARRTV